MQTSDVKTVTTDYKVMLWW